MRQSVIQDTPIQQDVFSYAQAQHVLGNMDDAEWKLYLKIYHSFEPYFSKPDLIMYLETSIVALENRIQSRGRSYEQTIPTTYLELLDKLNHQWLAENKTIPVLTIQTDGFNIVTSRKTQAVFIVKIRKYLEKQKLV